MEYYEYAVDWCCSGLALSMSPSVGNPPTSSCVERQERIRANHTSLT